jgi:predicted metalloprotease
MRYGPDDRESDQFEDRSGRGSPSPGGGRRITIPIGGAGGRGLGLGSLLIIGVACLFFGINPLTLLTSDGGIQIPIPDLQRPGSPRADAPDQPGFPGGPGVGKSGQEMKSFVRRVLADSEDVWQRVFQASGRTYEKPKLVVFSGFTNTACGAGEAAMGPFYCPVDRQIYIDLTFYEELKTKFGAPGDFAQAYVIAHEVGHHVQALLGIAEKVFRAKQRVSQVEANALQVRMELQADCFAGVWAALTHQMKKRLEAGDVEEGLAAASAIGDDTLQRKSQGRVVPDAFTHGSSAQRVRWFKRGLDTGQTQSCDTFNIGAREL